MLRKEAHGALTKPRPSVPEAPQATPILEARDCCESAWGAELQSKSRGRGEERWGECGRGNRVKAWPMYPRRATIGRTWRGGLKENGPCPSGPSVGLSVNSEWRVAGWGKMALIKKSLPASNFWGSENN